MKLKIFVGLMGLFALEGGPKKGTLRPAMVTDVRLVPKVVGHDPKEGKPILADQTIVDLTYFPSVNDQVGPGCNWAANVAVAERSDAAPVPRTFYVAAQSTGESSKDEKPSSKEALTSEPQKAKAGNTGAAAKAEAKEPSKETPPTV